MNVEELIEVLKTYDGKSKVHNRIAMMIRTDEENQKQIQENYNEFIKNKYIYDGLKNDMFYLEQDKDKTFLLKTKKDNKIIYSGLIDCKLDLIKSLYHDRHNQSRSYLVEDLGLYILDGWRK